MRRQRLVLPLALVAALATTATSASAVHRQRVLLDAVITRETASGPDSSHVGHRQIASGVLRDAAGRRLGGFRFTCMWTRILPGGDDLEHCTGAGRTADGRLDVAGPGRSSGTRLTWRVAGGSGAYRGARGPVALDQISPTEWLLTVTAEPRTGAELRAGVLPPVGTRFARRANAMCARASKRLAALPPFPLADFDPLHPGAEQLPAVGAFFTGPGDPRPILRDLTARLRTLGRAGHRLVRAHEFVLAVMTEQDHAALAADVAEFVSSVHQTTVAGRRLAVAASVAGGPRCIR